MDLLVVPAFGRDYRRNSEAREAWSTGVYFAVEKRTIQIFLNNEDTQAPEVWCLHNNRRTLSRLKP